MAAQRRRLVLSLLLALIGALAVSAAPARAGAIFSYESACTPLPCPDVGLDAGDTVSGRIEFTDSAILPNAAVSHLDIIDFSLDFGAIDITRASAFGFWFAGVLDATAQSFTEFMMIVSDSFEIPGGLLFLEVVGWAGGAGACLSIDCFDFFLINGSFGLETAIARLIDDPVPMPEPSAALLALVSIGWLARTRRRERLRS